MAMNLNPLTSLRCRLERRRIVFRISFPRAFSTIVLEQVGREVMRRTLPIESFCLDNLPTPSSADTLPRSDTASYTSMNSPTTSSVTTSGVGSGSTHFDIDFNESILQVHKRSPLYIIGDRAQHRVSSKETDYIRRERLFRPVDWNNFKTIVFCPWNSTMSVKSKPVSRN